MDDNNDSDSASYVRIIADLQAAVMTLDRVLRKEHGRSVMSYMRGQDAAQVAAVARIFE